MRISVIVTYLTHDPMIKVQVLCGPFLHSGLWVTLQLEHFGTPTGGLPAPLPPPVKDSFDARRDVDLEDAGTISSGAGVEGLTGVEAGDTLG